MVQKQLIKKRSKQSFRIVKYLVVGFFSLIIFYLILAFILSQFSLSGEDEKNSNIEIYIVNTGVHTDFILPKKNKLINWDTIYPIINTLVKDTSLSFIAIGWGDRNFFLNTPTWDDLTMSTALKATFGLGNAALHINYYEQVPTHFKYQKIMLSENQYYKLINYILENTTMKNNRPIQIVPAFPEILQNNDAYYESPGSYGLFYTCNTFINQGLIASGKRAALWTPFAGGIFHHYEE